MANVDSYGQLVMQSSQIVPLANTALTEATEDEIQTDANFVGAASPAGTFATQTLNNPRCVAAGISAENDVTYAYIRSAGKIKAGLPVSGLSSGQGLPGQLPYPVTLVSGDSVIVMSNAAADREGLAQMVSFAFSMGGNNAANFSSPVYFLNGSGTPVGSVTPNDPAVDTGTFQVCRANIALNTRVVVRTDA